MINKKSNLFLLNEAIKKIPKCNSKELIEKLLYQLVNNGKADFFFGVFTIENDKLIFKEKSFMKSIYSLDIQSPKSLDHIAEQVTLRVLEEVE